MSLHMHSEGLLGDPAEARRDGVNRNDVLATNGAVRQFIICQVRVEPVQETIAKIGTSLVGSIHDALVN